MSNRICRYCGLSESKTAALCLRSNNWQHDWEEPEEDAP